MVAPSSQTHELDTRVVGSAVIERTRADARDHRALPHSRLWGHDPARFDEPVAYALRCTASWSPGARRGGGRMPLEDAPITQLDLSRIGLAFVNVVASSASIGHRHIWDSVRDYAHEMEGEAPETAFVRDAFQLTSGEAAVTWFGSVYSASAYVVDAMETSLLGRPGGRCASRSPSRDRPGASSMRRHPMHAPNRAGGEPQLRAHTEADELTAATAYDLHRCRRRQTGADGTRPGRQSLTRRSQVQSRLCHERGRGVPRRLV